MSRYLLLGAIVACSVLAPAISANATPRAEIIALANKFITAFNKGDIATAKSTMTADASLIDEMPPFAWRGPGSVDAWLASVEADNTRMKDTNGFSVFGAPTYIRVDGDRAYAVFPDQFRYKRAGVRVTENATVTLVVERRAGGWVITSAAYSAAKH